jgi:hypothetical protein
MSASAPSLPARSTSPETEAYLASSLSDLLGTLTLTSSDADLSAIARRILEPASFNTEPFEAEIAARQKTAQIALTLPPPVVALLFNAVMGERIRTAQEQLDHHRRESASIRQEMGQLRMIQLMEGEQAARRELLLMEHQELRRLDAQHTQKRFALLPAQAGLSMLDRLNAAWGKETRRETSECAQKALADLHKQEQDKRASIVCVETFERKLLQTSMAQSRRPPRG